MITCKIKLFSKTKETVLRFLKLLEQLNASLNFMKFSIQLNKIKKKRKKIAILKSPHVNKKAQEHYQIIIYKATINYFSWETYKSIIFIKKIKNLMFPGLKIKIEKTICSKRNLPIKKLIKASYSKTQKLFLLKQREKLSLFTKITKKSELLTETLHYLKYLDTYGALAINYKKL